MRGTSGILGHASSCNEGIERFTQIKQMGAEAIQADGSKLEKKRTTIDDEDESEDGLSSSVTKNETFHVRKFNLLMQVTFETSTKRLLIDADEENIKNETTLLDLSNYFKTNALLRILMI